MTAFQIIAVLLSLAALCSYLNSRYVRFPASIGQMAFACIISIFLLCLDALGIFNFRPLATFIDQVDFPNVLLHGMLSFLLFAGALHINFYELRKVLWSVALLATVGVAIATFATGTFIWYAASWLGLQIPYPYALLFGALISPTDPIAVLSILKTTNLSKALYAKIGGESLFNDGIGVVAYITLLTFIMSAHKITASEISFLLVRQIVGGGVLGLVLGWIIYRMLRPIDEYRVEILLTLALAAGGYVFAEAINVSAPICMVTAGLLIGNHDRNSGMSEQSRRRLDEFWELIDETLNAILFMLIGLEIVVIRFSVQHVLLGAFGIIAMLIGRFVSVASVIGLLRSRWQYERGTIPLLTWGGLRGGLSIAMALSLPPGPQKNVLLPATYVVVMFSILIQGLTFKHVLKSFSNSGGK